MALIDDVKTTLRISNNAFDTEISDLISACKMDLELSGVVNSLIVDTDMLIKRAIISYVKANFGFNNPNADKFEQSYAMIKSHLTLSADYTEVV